MQRCELYDHTSVGAGWDVLPLGNDDPLLSRRCAFEEARYVAKVFKQDTIRDGWTDA